MQGGWLRRSVERRRGRHRFPPPIIQHEPDLVLHGHAHAGTFEGRLGDVPVYNVSMPLLSRSFPDRPAFRVFEVSTGEQPAAAPFGRRATDAVAS